MQGGSASGISMTAYVLISLLENKNNSDVSACYSEYNLYLLERAFSVIF